MYTIGRVFPNKKMQKFSGIAERKEIVSMGMMFGKGQYAQYIFMRWLNMPNMIFRPKDCKVESEEPNRRYMEEISEEKLEKDIKSFQKKLRYKEQIIYFEKYSEEGFVGREEFEFCGFDLMDDGLGTSAIVDCEDLNKSFVDKLNKYGLLDCAEDAISAQKQLLIDYPDEYHADTQIYGVWRYIKKNK